MDPIARLTSPQPEPAMWNVGITTWDTDSGVKSQFFGTSSMNEKRLRLLSITPLGSPVVPDVYSCRQMSSSVPSTPGSVVGCPAAHASMPSWVASAGPSRIVFSTLASSASILSSCGAKSAPTNNSLAPASSTI